MNKIAVIGTFVLLPIFAVSVLSQPETPTAILLTCQGEVTIIKGNSEQLRGTYGLPLYAGDEVRTGENGQAEVHFENGTWIQIGPKSTMQVKAGKIQSDMSYFNMGEQSFRVVQNFLKLKDSEGTTSLAPLRSIGKDREIVPLSPCLTKVRGPRPIFHWKTSNPLQELRLTVYNEEGIHWKQNIRGETSMAYPEDAPALEAGMTYSWTLETVDPLVFPPLRSKAAFFEILSPDNEQVLREALEKIESEKLPSKSTYHLMRASLFFSYSLMEEALTETQMALAIDPGNEILHAILARLYAESGRTEEALSEYDQLIEKR